MDEMKEPAIEVEGLTVQYDTAPALWEVSFSIPQGVVVGILGPNGAGKSTLVKALLGLLKPASGKISFFGQAMRASQGDIAYVPQRTSVDWHFPIDVEGVVLMGRYGKLGRFKWPQKADRIAAHKALELVGMSAFAKRQISQLSGGQQQRVFIARALLQEAKIYLMDEPFAGVDMATEKALVELFASLKGEGKTLLIVHHDLTTVKSYFDWTVLLNTCLIGYGPVSEVFTQEHLKRCFGSSAYLFTETKKRAQTTSTGDTF